MTVYPCITLWQPWASLIAYGAKPFEFRRWCAPKRLWGKRIAIHAAKRPVNSDDREWWHSITGSETPLPLGVFVCTAILCAVFSTCEVKSDAFGDYGPGRFAWKLEDCKPFDPPIPAIGRQGFWTVRLLAPHA